MTLGNMREHGVRAVDASCEACKHEAVVNVDKRADDDYVPDVGLKPTLLCVRLKEDCRAPELGTASAFCRLSR